MIRTARFVLFLALTALMAACAPKEGSDQVERGRELYAANCQICHGDAATGKGARLNTPVHGVSGHTWHHPDGQLEGIILGRLEYPERTMPSFADKLSEQDVRAILAFFKDNWLPEQRAFQQEVSENWEKERGGRP